MSAKRITHPSMRRLGSVGDASGCDRIDFFFSLFNLDLFIPIIPLLIASREGGSHSRPVLIPWLMVVSLIVPPSARYRWPVCRTGELSRSRSPASFGHTTGVPRQVARAACGETVPWISMTYPQFQVKISCHPQDCPAPSVLWQPRRCGRMVFGYNAHLRPRHPGER